MGRPASMSDLPMKPASCVPFKLVEDLSADELHAVATAFDLARETGLIDPQMSPRHPTVTLVRCEARIAVRRVRGQGHGPQQLEHIAMSAMQALIERQARKQPQGTTCA